MNIEIGKKALITTDNWFYAPDGRSYRAVFGTVRSVRGDQETLGIRTNARSTNWYVEIGNVTLAGCQVHYAIRADAANTGTVEDSREESGQVHEFARASYIYDADAGAESLA
ncbi:hypothetical protein [Pseudomonas kurunegalensis]|uniref:hypothetical protein n=1 Tax=Pseudomonas kurunegalensis TaxID=485880 RepID=UPI002363F2F9|nr:hypothetical protein [Pseudomonas kurunegalensis]MDD2133348.1 hypothetical protein [Pseudomonas kurunegalensis]